MRNLRQILSTWIRTERTLAGNLRNLIALREQIKTQWVNEIGELPNTAQQAKPTFWKHPDPSQAILRTKKLLRTPVVDCADPDLIIADPSSLSTVEMTYLCNKAIPALDSWPFVKLTISKYIYICICMIYDICNYINYITIYYISLTLSNTLTCILYLNA